MGTVSLRGSAAQTTCFEAHDTLSFSQAGTKLDSSLSSDDGQGNQPSRLYATREKGDCDVSEQESKSA